MAGFVNASLLPLHGIPASIRNSASGRVRQRLCGILAFCLSRAADADFVQGPRAISPSPVSVGLPFINCDGPRRLAELRCRVPRRDFKIVLVMMARMVPRSQSRFLTVRPAWEWLSSVSLVVKEDQELQVEEEEVVAAIAVAVAVAEAMAEGDRRRKGRRRNVCPKPKQASSSSSVATSFPPPEICRKRMSLPSLSPRPSF